MKTENLQWDRIQTVLADGEWHAGTEIAEVMSWSAKGVCSRMVSHIESGAVIRELKSVGPKQRYFYKLAPNVPAKEIPQISPSLPRNIYSADRQRQRNHDQVGTARNYDRRPGGAAS